MKPNLNKSIKNTLREGSSLKGPSGKSLLTEQTACSSSGAMVGSILMGGQMVQTSTLGPFGCHGFERCDPSQGGLYGPIAIFNVYQPPLPPGTPLNALPPPTNLTDGIGTNEMFYQWVGSPNVGDVVQYDLHYSNGNFHSTAKYRYVGTDPSYIMGTAGYLFHSNPQLSTCPGDPVLDEYHMWTECSDFTGAGGSQGMTWSGLPGYVSGSDVSNSQIFYDWIDTTIGGISVGDVIKIDLTATQTYTLCLQYDGVTTNVTPVTPWNSPLSIVSNHLDCDDCVNGSTENFACMGGIIPGPGTCMGPGNYSMGQTYVQAVYPTMADCQADPKCGSTQDERGCLDINALNYNVCCDNDPNCIVTIPDPECCRYENEPDHRGCMDSTAINYMDCCDQTIPGCTPTLSNPECCRYEGRGTEDKGCMDPNALNNGECCDGDPNCTAIYSNPECCRYEGDPNPCDTNPKECWFCEPGDISTSGWVDPMALTNSNGGCIQFLSTSATFASNYTGQMFTTKIDCENNTECSPSDGGETKHCTCCKKGENGTISGFSLGTAIPVGDSCSQFNNSQPGLYGCVDTNLWSLSKCKNQGPVPTNNTQLSEEIKRYKELL